MQQHKVKKKALAMTIACALALSLTPTFGGFVYAADADSEQQQETAYTADAGSKEQKEAAPPALETGETKKKANTGQSQAAGEQAKAAGEVNPGWQEAMGKNEQEYQLPTLTVEADRPEWEKKLSPGTVSVVYPDQFKGEQKSLPDLLERVPGVHIRLINGTGQYTVATVRGSTSAQVDIFVDGVLTKLGGDAATDLSMIPMENVARIEVYRGYIPARFPGTWLGGVINIVTKKPQKAGGSFSQGMSSYGGYQGNLNVNFPLGDGSFLLGVNRDQSDGDFRYTNLR